MPELPIGDFGGLKVTPRVIEEVESYDADAQRGPSEACVPPSVTYVMQAPFPMEVHATPQIIVFKMEYYDIVRIVFMDGRKHPGPMRRTRRWALGGALGRQRLVVDTTHVAPATMFNNGFNHSDGLHLVERFRVSPDGKTLWITQLYEDPAAFEGRAARYMAFRVGRTTATSIRSTAIPATRAIDSRTAGEQTSSGSVLRWRLRRSRALPCGNCRRSRMGRGDDGVIRELRFAHELERLRERGLAGSRDRARTRCGGASPRSRASRSLESVWPSSIMMLDEQRIVRGAVDQARGFDQRAEQRDERRAILRGPTAVHEQRRENDLGNVVADVAEVRVARVERHEVERHRLHGGVDRAVLQCLPAGRVNADDRELVVAGIAQPVPPSISIV